MVTAHAIGALFSYHFVLPVDFACPEVLFFFVDFFDLLDLYALDSLIP
jgi:hypothetical protein